MKWPNKDPNETLDYSLDWSRFLRTGETISSSVWFITNSSGEVVSFDSGDTIDSLTNVINTNSTSITTINLSGGNSNTLYKLVCRVTLSTGFVAERSVSLYIKER